MFDVLEHIYTDMATLKTLTGRFNEQGKLFLL